MFTTEKHFQHTNSKLNRLPAQIEMALGDHQQQKGQAQRRQAEEQRDPLAAPREGPPQQRNAPGREGTGCCEVGSETKAATRKPEGNLVWGCQKNTEKNIMQEAPEKEN